MGLCVLVALRTTQRDLVNLCTWSLCCSSVLVVSEAPGITLWEWEQRNLGSSEASLALLICSEVLACTREGLLSAPAAPLPLGSPL